MEGKSKLKKGQKLVCSPCGREVSITSSGISQTTIWCCGNPMEAGRKKAAKKAGKKAVKKKAAKKPASGKAKKK